MKRRFAFFMVLLTVILVSVFSCADQADEPIRCMSFNIRYNNPQDGENAWPLRKEMVARTFTVHCVDAAGLQEPDTRQIEEMHALLPEYDWVGVGSKDGKEKGPYDPIFYRRDRLRLLNSDTFWLSEHPDSAGSFGWDASHTRIVTWAKFKDRRHGRIFFLFNTHLDYAGTINQPKSAALILTKIKKIADRHPVVLTGDFNCTRESSAYLTFTSGPDGLQDTWSLSENGHYGGTLSANAFGKDMRTDYVIDHILVQRVRRVANHGIVAERWDGRFVSDHYPVLADIYLP